MSSKPKKRIMRAFKLDEISAVDVPAQERAEAVIMKSAGLRELTDDELDLLVAKTLVEVRKQRKLDQQIDDDEMEAYVKANGVETDEEEDEDEFEDEEVKEEKPMSKHTLPFAKADIEAAVAELQSRNPKLSEKRATEDAIAWLLAKHGLYEQVYCVPTSAVMKAAEQLRQVTKAVITFEKCINDIRSRDECTRVEAMQKARKEHPEEFEAYQGL